MTNVFCNTVLFSLGYATLPFFIILNRRDKENIVCVASFFVPTIIMTICILLFPIIFETSLDSDFIIWYGFYFYIYCFLCIYNYLTFWKVSKWMMLINPCTYVLAVCLFPFVFVWPLFVFLLSENHHKEEVKEMDELENLGILKDVAKDIIEYENKQHEEIENIVNSFNNLILNNARPDKGPKNQKGEDACSVCTNALRQGDILIKTKCNHVYHLQCLKDRYKVYKDCKECREPINMEEV